MSSEDLQRCKDLLEEIEIEYEESGKILNVESAQKLIELMYEIRYDERIIETVGKMFINIHDGNHGTEPAMDGPPESARIRLFNEISKVIGTAVAIGLTTNSTDRNRSNLRIELKPDGHKILTWESVSTKITTPAYKAAEPTTSDGPSAKNE
ncbi:hypothetical protein HA402_008340 [Bradysia odoriphaga]|nr:hypothetical protein HA402_008340 [Bradysia odoriphaga]